MSILDVIKGKAEAPQLGQTEAVQRLATAQTGRAAEGPRLSSQQEKIAQTQTVSALQGAVEEQGLQFRQFEEEDAELRQRAEQSSQKLTEQSLNVSQQMQLQATKLIDNFQRDKGQLELNKTRARIEQLGFNLRLSNQQYVDKLKAAGRRARLDNAVKFQEALAETVFRDEMSLFNNDLNFRSLLRANDRDFEKEIAAMDIETALKLSSLEVETAQAQQMWGGIGQILQTGVAAYGIYDENRDKVNKKALGMSGTPLASTPEDYTLSGWRDANTLIQPPSYRRPGGQ